MSNEVQTMGTCLCGAVNIIATNVSRSVGACHCNMCRKWGGGPLMAVDCGSEVSFEGAEYISVYDSSEWAERGFCRTCGTHLFYRIKATQQHIVPVGMFEDDDTRVFDHQVFIDQKPNFYSFANETENMTAAEVFAKYAPDSG